MSVTTTTTTPSEVFPERIEEFIHLINPYNPAGAILEAILGLRKLLSLSDQTNVETYTNKMIELKVLDQILNLLKVINEKIQNFGDSSTSEEMTTSEMVKVLFEATWALTNLCSSSSAACLHVIQHRDEYFPIFGAILSRPVVPPHPGYQGVDPDQLYDLISQVIWLIGNVAGEGAQLVKAILDTPPPMLLAPMISLVSSLPISKNVESSPTAKSNEILRNATWTMSNLCRTDAKSKIKPDINKVLHFAPIFTQLFVMADDNDVKLDAAWGLSYIAGNGKQGLQAFVETGVLPKMCKVLASSSSSSAPVPTPSVRSGEGVCLGSNNNNALVMPCLRCIGEIASGDDPHFCQMLIQSGLLPVLTQLLNSPKKAVQKEATWILSNIAADSPQTGMALIESNSVPQLINLLKTAPNEIKNEAAFTLANLLTTSSSSAGGSKTSQIARFLVEHGLVAVLCEVIAASFRDAKLLCICLETLDGLLEAFSSDDKDKDMKKRVLEMIESAGGLTTLEQLQEHENNHVYQLVAGILENHFYLELKDDGEADEEEEQEGEGEE